MSTHVVIIETQPASTVSCGRSDFDEDAFDPRLATTNGTFPDDPFFRISPAIAVGDAYVNEGA